MSPPADGTNRRSRAHHPIHNQQQQQLYEQQQQQHQQQQRFPTTANLLTHSSPSAPSPSSTNFNPTATTTFIAPSIPIHSSPSNFQEPATTTTWRDYPRDYPPESPSPPKFRSNWPQHEPKIHDTQLRSPLSQFSMAVGGGVLQSPTDTMNTMNNPATKGLGLYAMVQDLTPSMNNNDEPFRKQRARESSMMSTSSEDTALSMASSKMIVDDQYDSPSSSTLTPIVTKFPPANPTMSHLHHHYHPYHHSRRRSSIISGDSSDGSMVNSGGSRRSSMIVDEVAPGTQSSRITPRRHRRSSMGIKTCTTKVRELLSSEKSPHVDEVEHERMTTSILKKSTSVEHFSEEEIELLTGPQAPLPLRVQPIPNKKLKSPAIYHSSSSRLNPENSSLSVQVSMQPRIPTSPRSPSSDSSSSSGMSGTHSCSSAGWDRFSNFHREGSVDPNASSYNPSPTNSGPPSSLFVHPSLPISIPTNVTSVATERSNSISMSSTTSSSAHIGLKRRRSGSLGRDAWRYYDDMLSPSGSAMAQGVFETVQRSLKRKLSDDVSVRYEPYKRIQQRFPSASPTISRGESSGHEHQIPALVLPPPPLPVQTPFTQPTPANIQPQQQQQQQQGLQIKRDGKTFGQMLNIQGAGEGFGKMKLGDDE